MEAYKFTFSQPGALTPPINYYRNIFNRVQKDKTSAPRTIDIPVLLIWVSGTIIQLTYSNIMLEFIQGDDDAFLETAMADKHGGICTSLASSPHPSVTN